MPIQQTRLTIEGQPGEKVSVMYRDRGDDPPPPIWEGNLDSEGRVTIDVPQAYLAVVGKSETQGLELHKTNPTSLTVRLSEK
jgi:hypothetical protein